MTQTDYRAEPAVTALSEHGDAVLAAMEELIRRARRRIDVVLAAQIPHTSQLHAASTASPCSDRAVTAGSAL